MGGSGELPGPEKAWPNEQQGSAISDGDHGEPAIARCSSGVSLAVQGLGNDMCKPLSFGPGGGQFSIAGFGLNRRSGFVLRSGEKGARGPGNLSIGVCPSGGIPGPWTGWTARGQ